MPNRIIKESICTSESIDRLDSFTEVFFYRLIVHCDDYGRMEARPMILRAELFPLKERLPLIKIEQTLESLEKAGCIRRYESDKKQYIAILSWEKHQRIRAKRSKYPPPSWYGKKNDDSEPPKVPVLSMALKNRSQYCIYADRIEKFSRAFPRLDIKGELLKMQTWLQHNPKRRRSERGMPRFMTEWLESANKALPE